MPDHSNIYAKEAEKYHQLISKQADLTDRIEEIRPFSGLDIVELGAGTGRFTASLAARAKSIIALDASEAMLRLTADRLIQAGLTNWRTQAADHRMLPLEDQSADLIVAGWSICYLGSTNVQNWEQNIHEIVGEIKRVLRSNGTVIIFETLGTGNDTPKAPDFLRKYYSMLTDDYGFSHKWIRTDYLFDSLEQAEELTRFFFGEELADRVIKQNLVHLPECAGIWWLQLPQA
ncbi:class I SAM-dependent methyltransferase [Paenibacillus radicis (ex Xue et al. 2023)]|uniref:Class I SAM-dependent methyltransferase n=1 Tax=Paenibacillus radicis (ex Xue et al. 2023) TaxID=2972489 RepID=A0ABT1YMI8_9BACL|nr:class I SAM-dependent methyltransferase [Paenibacillus radicis (ex Xue et al. 2023)]MCR8634242.1 class I SAM-dependent methyltransferase [Paenibacillus radicis (ex Xue et al. 2023)]